ncbi:MAG TPA: hemerythrin domain-containing protein [Candidatus Acidoferrales bacterium]|nr:hemerythrin domain-containing protein [Candidatus Acidoferrales bacterium]
MTEHPIALVERHILDRAHRAVEHVLARLDVAAEMAGTMGGPELSGLVRDLLDSVDATLLPHMAWEEQVCFPETDRLAGTPWATRILYLQHAQIRRRLADLRADRVALHDEPGARRAAHLRGQLYGLHAILGSHLEQEEHALLTVLVTAPGGADS